MQKRLRTFATRWLGGVLAFCSATAVAQIDARSAAALESIIEQGLTDWQTPGLVVAIVKDDTVLRAAGFGVREAGKPARLDGHSLIGIGSTSKAFGAAAIAHLAQQGKASWDDRVTSHLPWFELYDPWVTHEVRLRDILSHRVGLDLSDENRLFPVAENARDFVRRLRFIAPARPFRSDYVYSNAMFTTAGLVIEAAAGRPWDDYVRDVIWKPLGMHATTTKLADVLKMDNRAVAHALIDGQLRVLPQWEPDGAAVTAMTGPSGAVISTAHDMAQWLRFQLGRGTVDGRVIVDEAAFREMHLPHSPMRDVYGATSWFVHTPASALHIGAQSYALGWRISSFRGRQMIWHGGTISGFRTVVAMLPERRLAVFVSGNRESLLPFAVTLAIFDADLGATSENWSQMFLTERRLQDEARRKREAERDAARRPNTKPSLPLQAYAGSYDDEAAFGRIEVRSSGGKLAVQFGTRTGDLEHWHFDTFRIHWRGPVPDHDFASFAIDAGGRVAALELDDHGRFARRH